MKLADFVVVLYGRSPEHPQILHTSQNVLMKMKANDSRRRRVHLRERGTQ